MPCTPPTLRPGRRCASNKTVQTATPIWAGFHLTRAHPLRRLKSSIKPFPHSPLHVTVRKPSPSRDNSAMSPTAPPFRTSVSSPTSHRSATHRLFLVSVPRRTAFSTKTSPTPTGPSPSQVSQLRPPLQACTTSSSSTASRAMFPTTVSSTMAM